MLSFSPSRGPLKLYQDYHIFPIIARRYVKVDTEREFFTSFVQLAETLMLQARPAANPRASRSVLAFALNAGEPWAHSIVAVGARKSSLSATAGGKGA